ncbi:HD domain-containing phosphohydrolase [Thermodesulfobacteriota bacterium]
MDKKRILVVEDDKITAKLISKSLQELGYSVSSVVPSGEEAIQKVEEDAPDLVLMDIVLEGDMDGIAAAKEIRFRFQIPVIYLTGYAEDEFLDRVKITEPYGYILKPFNTRELHTNIEIALYKHNSEQQLKAAYTRLKKTFRKTIDAMSMISEISDPFLTGHQQRTAKLAQRIAKQMGLNEDRIEATYLAAIIHDIGLKSVPFEILNKPKRSKDDDAIYQTHVMIGYNILKTIDFQWPVDRIVFQHHERIDGSGYPQGLLGENIIMEAKILAVADMVETKTSHRPYRSALDIQSVLEDISKHQGVLYDTDVVDACVKLFSERRHTDRYPLEDLT